jgi:hypothetical protein
MSEWENKFHDFLDKSQKSLLDMIADGKWDETVEKNLKEAIEDYKKSK